MASLHYASDYARDAGLVPEEQTELECAGCLQGPMKADDLRAVETGGDEECLPCVAEHQAFPIVLAEIQYPFTPSRSLDERRAAIEVMREVLALAEKRVAEAESIHRAQVVALFPER